MRSACTTARSRIAIVGCARSSGHLEHAAGRALFGTSGIPSDSDSSVAGMRTDGVANTNLVWHANKLLALEEGHGPIELDPVSLETIGRWSFNNKLPRNMTAHPKIDPDSGEMIFFANFPTGRSPAISRSMSRTHPARLVRSQMIDGPFPALVHDFAVTRDFVVVAMCPVTVSIKRAMAGAPLIAWEPELGTQVGIMPRNGGVEECQMVRGRRLHGLASYECVQRRRQHCRRRLPAGGPVVSAGGRIAN